MRKTNLILFLVGSFWGSGLLAQTSPLEAPKARSNCRIALPYQADLFSDCSPETAAAYDFAFCSVSYIITSISAPDTDKPLGENSKSEASKRKGMAYANLSAALSDSTTLQKNVELTKKFYESLNGQDRQSIGSSIEYVYMKCSNIEAWHSGVLIELAQKLKLQPREGR